LLDDYNAAKKNGRYESERPKTADQRMRDLEEKFDSFPQRIVELLRMPSSFVMPAEIPSDTQPNMVRSMNSSNSTFKRS